MSRVFVCTAVYEAGRRFIPHYCAALIRAAAGRDAVALLAVDDLADPGAAFAPLMRRMETHFVAAPPGSTPAAVRATMLEAARRSDAGALILLDLDDIPAPDLIDLHLAALERAEVSFGDVRLVDAEGRPLAESFFEGAGVPEEATSPDALAARNFLGFSNAAIRRDALNERATAIPTDLVAADWWFFTTLLEAGARARRTARRVADYRMHEGNALGGRPDPALPAVLRRAQMMRDHYAALPPSRARAEADRRVARLMDLAARAPDRIAEEAARACAAPGVWFDDVMRLAAWAEGEFACPTVS